MFKHDSRRWTSGLARTAAVVLMAAGLGIGAGTSAQEPGGGATVSATQLASVELVDLETAFWVCEYAATERGNANLANCTAIYDALKARKFGGDFDGLLKWWQAHRESAYQRLATADTATMRGR